MDRSPAINAAHEFLTVVWGGDPPTDEALLASLDCLVAAYHSTPAGDVLDADVYAPRQEGSSLYQEVAKRFPEHGAYPVADPSASLDDALMLADAIDDLADITLDMREVIWLEEHVGINDAHFTYRLLFFHWGEHARRLALYLSSRLWG